MIARSCSPLLRMVGVLLLLLPTGSATFSVRASEPPAAGRWFMVETHVHSVFSADATADIGILATRARALGYDAVFLTDHNEGSSFQIEGETANARTLDEDDEGWKLKQHGDLAQATAQLENVAAFQGNRAFHLTATSSDRGSLALWAPRGPLVAAGPVRFSFALLVRRLDPGTGLAATISLGGNPVIRRPLGYTSASGAVLQGRSVLFAWTIGQPALPTPAPNQRVIVFPLPEPTLGEWTSYVLDIDAALAQLPPDEQPHPFAALLDPSFLVTTQRGTIDLFLDAVTLRAERPLAPAEEFIARTALCQAFSDDTFALFCAHEMGQQKHVIRFDFAITEPAQFTSFTEGTDGIALVQAAGYPVQLNHPGSTIRIRDILENDAYGADFIEVRKPEWTTVWDELLQRGIPILGSFGTDSHELIDRGNPATFVYAPSLRLDTIVRALYEGRSFLARNTFRGTVWLSTRAGADEPPAARYPIFVSHEAETTTVFAELRGNLAPATHLRWIVNGRPSGEQALGTTPTSLPFELPLAGPLTVVRAELLAADGTVIALTQPLFFRDVPGLPRNYRLRVNRIETLTGQGYNRVMTAGIVDAGWDRVLRALLLTLHAPALARLELLLETDPPHHIELAGTPLPIPPSQGPFLVSFVQPAATSDLVVGFANVSATLQRSPPDAPRALRVAAASSSTVELRWEPATNRDRPLRYRITRNGQFLASVGTTTAFHDRSVRPSQQYRYVVETLDLAGLRSLARAELTVVTPPPIMFKDDFESGTLANWITHGPVMVQERSGTAENRAACLDFHGAPAALVRPFPVARMTLHIRFRFQVLDQQSTRLQIVELSDQNGRGVTRLVLAENGRLAIDDGRRTLQGSELLAFGVWYGCSLNVSPAGSTHIICQAEDASQPVLDVALPPPWGSVAVSTLIFGQSTGVPRGILLVDDVLLAEPSSTGSLSFRPWSWGDARGRR